MACAGGVDEGEARVNCAGGEDGEVARVKGGTEDAGWSPIVDPSIPTPIFGSNLVLRSCLL